jgi:hypothetical protein
VAAAGAEELRRTPFVDGFIRPSRFARLPFDSGRMAQGRRRSVDSLAVVVREMDMRISLLGSLVAVATIAAAPSAAPAEIASNEVAPAATAANPSASPSASADTAAKPAPDAQKKVCKLLATSGTHLADRVCLTKSEWKQVEDELR